MKTTKLAWASAVAVLLMMAATVAAAVAVTDDTDASSGDIEGTVSEPITTYTASGSFSYVIRSATGVTSTLSQNGSFVELKTATMSSGSCVVYGLTVAVSTTTYAYSVTISGSPTVSGTIGLKVNFDTDDNLGFGGGDVGQFWEVYCYIEAAPDPAVTYTHTANLAFSANGGSGAPSSLSYSYTDSNTGASGSHAFTIPTTVPTLSGYTFLGWSLSSSATAASYAAGSSISVTNGTNVTLYAVWKATTYTVTYDANGGTGTIDAQTVNAGTSVTLPTTGLTRSGYTFMGWTTSAAGTSILSTPYTPTSNVTLYAVWKNAEYTVSFDANGGTGSVSHMIVQKGSSIALPASGITRDGKSFLGWATASDSTTVLSSPYTPTADTTLYAVWGSIEYCTVSFNSNGGTGSMSSEVFHAGVAQNITSCSFVRDGYYFTGWSLSTTGAVLYTDNERITLTPTSTSAVWYAVWKVKDTSVQAPSASFSVAISGLIATFTDTSVRPGVWQWSFGDTTTSTEQNPVHTYEKAGSYEVSLTVSNASGVSDIATKTISVGQAGVFTITFDSVGGSSVDSIQSETNGEVTLPATTKGGYAFVGWYDQDNNSVGNAGSVIILTADLSVVAHWASGDTALYTVKFVIVEKDTGKQLSAGQQTVAYGGKVTSWEPTSVGEGYSAWYTDLGMTALYSFSTQVTGDMTLYCLMTHVAVPEPVWMTYLAYVLAALGAVCAVVAITVMPLVGIPAVVLIALAAVILWVL